VARATSAGRLRPAWAPGRPLELEREVRKLALAAGVDYESALAEAEEILRNAQQNDREPGPSY
jgi:hypothetical protein